MPINNYLFPDCFINRTGKECGLICKECLYKHSFFNALYRGCYIWPLLGIR
nr:MAG TPA: hypothetical protein [Caudoviricetes sp.]